MTQETTTEVLKLTTDELKLLITIKNKIDQLTLELGNAELTKQLMFNEHINLKGELDHILKILEDKYGPVNINLNDGSYEIADTSKNQ